MIKDNTLFQRTSGYVAGFFHLKVHLKNYWQQKGAPEAIFELCHLDEENKKHLFLAVRISRKRITGVRCG